MNTRATPPVAHRTGPTKGRTRITRRTASIALLTALGVTLVGVSVAEQAFIAPAGDPDVQDVPCPEFMPEGCTLGLLQGDPSQPNADVLFRLLPGTTAPRHWHTSAERMVMISGELEVTYDGQDPVTLTPGTYAYGPPRLPHSATCRSDEPCVLFIAFEEPVDAVAGDAQ